MKPDTSTQQNGMLSDYVTPEVPHTSWGAVLGKIGLCTVAALGLYTATYSFLLTPYVNKGSDAGRVVGVYEGYDQIAATTDHSRELVLFWGSSMVREGVDCNLVDAQDDGITAYNLSVSGDIPYRRIVELPRVQKLKPKRMVIGVSYEVFETRNPFEDQIGALPAEAYREMPADAQGLMNERFREIAGRSAWERFWWKRKFLLSAVCWKLGVPDRSNPIPPGYVNNLKAPYVYTKNIKPAELDRFLRQRGGYYPPYTAGGELDLTKGTSAKSLALIVRELEKQGTQIVLVNMPLHPLLNAAIPAERRAALDSYIRSLAGESGEVLDCQYLLGGECFVDLLHLNKEGRVAFTEMMARDLSGRKGTTFTTVSR